MRKLPRLKKNKELRIGVFFDIHDENARIFAVRYKLSDEEEVYCGFSDAVEWNLVQKRKNEAFLLARDLLGIRGVESIIVCGYEANIQLGKMFSWKERDIKKKILFVIERYLKNRHELEKIFRQDGAQ